MAGVARVKCPECGSKEVVKDGFAKVIVGRKVSRKQKYLCMSCFRRFREKSH